MRFKHIFPRKTTVSGYVYPSRVLLLKINLELDVRCSYKSARYIDYGQIMHGGMRQKFTATPQQIKINLNHYFVNTPHHQLLSPPCVEASV